MKHYNPYEIYQKIIKEIKEVIKNAKEDYKIIVTPNKIKQIITKNKTNKIISIDDQSINYIELIKLIEEVHICLKGDVNYKPSTIIISMPSDNDIIIQSIHYCEDTEGNIYIRIRKEIIRDEIPTFQIEMFRRIEIEI